MRFFEIKGGIQVPLSNEERRLVEEIEKGNTNYSEFDERDSELAWQLSKRGILNLIEHEDGNVTCKVNKLEDIWRD